MLHAAGDEHLVGVGRQAAGHEQVGDRLAQRSQPARVVAGAAGVVAQIADRLGGRLDQLGRGGTGGAAQIDHIGLFGRDPGARGGDALPGRQGGPAAGAAPAGQMTGGAQLAVGRGDGGPADAQHVGQLPLGRQADAQAQPAVPDQAGHRAGERRVLRQAGAARASGGLPPVEHPGQVRTSYDRGHDRLP